MADVLVVMLCWSDIYIYICVQDSGCNGCNDLLDLTL